MSEPVAPGAPVNVHRCADYDYCYHPRPQDVELIELVSQGMWYEQISDRLGLPIPTIKYRLYNLYREMGVRDRASLVRRAFELGLLSIEGAEPYVGRYHAHPLDVALIELVSQGLQNKQIAQVDPRVAITIRNRLSTLYQEWNVCNRPALVRRAIELGLLSIERAA